MSYGNVDNHPSINGFIVKSFIKLNSEKPITPDFKNYEFRLNKDAKFYGGNLTGDYIVKSGYFNPSQLDNWKGDQLSNFELIGASITYEEKSWDATPEEWIKHGGFSADVPEVPASLRHFYDPTQSKVNRYLTDIVNSAPLEIFRQMMDDPETNGVDWALGSKGLLGTSEHTYTWEHGKAYMKGALETANLDKRNRFMAKSWRSLGETLHMIADNGCPAHVRNDGHPSIPYFLLSYFGNPDFYEEDMAIRKNKIEEFNTGNVSELLKSIFEKQKTAESIAHELAVFTNKNFFTTETISGTDWKGNNIKQITHADYEYSSPKISSGNYEENYYRSRVDGLNTEVLLATDTWFFMKYPLVKKTYPFIDEECVTSQAKVLIPAIVEAGVNVMKLFIPKLKIVISEVKEDGTITGEIIHKIDQEYTQEIKYNGPVTIKELKVIPIKTLNAENGKFSGKIEVKEKTFATAEIEFGGIAVQSDEFEINVKKEENIIEEIDVQKDETNEKAWVLKEIILEDRKKQVDEQNKRESNKKYEIKHLQNSSYFKATRGDEIFEVQFKWTDPLKIIEPNTVVSLSISGTTIKNTVRRNDFYCFGIDIKAGATAYLINEANEKYLWSSGIRDKNGIEMMYLSCDAQYPTWNEKFYMKKFPQGQENDTLTIIIAISNCGSFNDAFTKYTYVWE